MDVPGSDYGEYEKSPREKQAYDLELLLVNGLVVYVVHSRNWKGGLLLTAGIDKIYAKKDAAIRYIADKLCDNHKMYRDMSDSMLYEKVLEMDFIEELKLESDY